MPKNWPSWPLQGLTTDSHKPMQCLMPRALGQGLGGCTLSPTTQYTRKLQPRTAGFMTPGVLRELCYPDNTLFPDSYFLALLPCFPTHCYHVTVLCTSIPAMSLGKISQPSHNITHFLDFISIHFSCPHPGPYLKPCHHLVRLTLQFQLAPPLSTSPGGSPSSFIPPRQ